MKLRSSTAHTFDLRTVGYEFSDLEPVPDRFDANWLTIEVKITDLNGASFTFRDSCLLTWDVKALASWFDRIARGENTEAALTFMEPILLFVFDRAGSPAVVRVAMNKQIDTAIEALPSFGDAWLLIPGQSKREWPCLEFPVDPDQFRQAGESLNRQLLTYAERAITEQLGRA